jgi:lipopolysaccharide transport system ATP-binding protein
LSAAITAEGLSKSYFIRVRQPDGSVRRVERKALDALGFEVPEGAVFGIIGRNGAGKTTLLRILSRITSPSAGRAVVRGRVAALLEVGTGMHPEMTGRENVFLNGALLGMARAEVAQRLDQIVEFAGIGEYLDTPIKFYSSGMRLRLAFAVGAHLSADILIVDEVLAVGDAAFQSKCLGVMREGGRRGRTTLFVSHNLAAVESLCSQVLWLDHGLRKRLAAPAETISAYLAASASERVDGSKLREPADPRLPVRFTDLAVSGGGGDVVRQGGDLVLAIGLDVVRPVKGLQVQVRVETMEGQQVASACSGDYRQDWDLAPGRYRLSATMAAVRLLPRRHFVSLSAFSGWGAERYHDLSHALSFEVVPSDVLGTGVALLADRGVTWLPTEFSLSAD